MESLFTTFSAAINRAGIFQVHTIKPNIQFVSLFMSTGAQDPVTFVSRVSMVIVGSGAPLGARRWGIGLITRERLLKPSTGVNVKALVRP